MIHIKFNCIIPFWKQGRRISAGCHRLTLLALVFLSGCALWATVPAGYYYQARNTRKAELKSALSVVARPLKVLSYGSGEGATWQGFYLTDRNADNSVVDRYSNINRQFDGFKGIPGMHIEHSLPKSWWGGADNMAYRDLFHLYPSDGITNSNKSNHPLGTVENATASYSNGVSKIGTNTFGTTYNGLAFEPADEFKGDFARSYLYIATVYEQLASQWSSPMMERNTYPVWIDWARDLLLKWHSGDPVSTQERLRQEAVYSIQGNRNPYIDFPELVSYIWGSDTTSVFPFPVETEAFLVSPRRGYSVDFDLILQGDTVGKNIELKGINFTGDLALRLKNQSQAFAIRRTGIAPSELLSGASARLVFQPARAGTFRDTLVLEGGGLTQPLMVPLEGKASRQLMALEPENVTPVGASLHWIADPLATGYEVTVTRGALRAGNLLISSYVEGSKYNKAIEIYNGTGARVSLSDYAVAKQSNGTGAYEAVFTLKGELADGESVVIINKLCDNETLKSMAGLYTDSVMNFNGNDAVALLHNHLRIDAVGFFDAGAELLWGENKTLHRKPTITHPTTVFNETEWVATGEDDFSSLHHHSILFSDAETQVAQQMVEPTSTRYNIHTLDPVTDYNYRVRVLRSGVIVNSVNSVRFRTLSPLVPVALEPAFPGSSRFLAEWESDLYTDRFELQAYTLQGQPDTAVIETFDGVGTSGKPLPTGWTGTASGNYTTTTSSGAAPPALALKNTGEWVQSPEYPYAVSEFSFMYRFPSGAGSSSLLVEAYSKSQQNWKIVDSIRYVNTSKTIRSYYFQKEEDIRAIRVSYRLKASTANLAIDDWRAVYGNLSNVYVIQNQPVTGTSYEINGLQPHTEYYFSVRSVIGSVRSEWSDPLRVTTVLESGIPREKSAAIRWYHTPTGIVLSDLSPGSQLSVYTVTGQCLGNWVAGHSTLELTLSHHRVLIVKVVDSHALYSFKLLI